MCIVLSELDIIGEIELCSDRLSPKDLEKMESEYAKELKSDKKFETNQIIWKYVQNSVGKDKEVGEEKKEEETKTEMKPEVTISQNPKLNVNLAVGFKD